MKNTITLNKELRSLIKNGDFNGARDFVKQAHSESKWCDLFNAKGDCYKPASEDAPSKMLAKIESEEVCFNSIEETAKSIKSSNRASELSDLMNTKCSGLIFTKYPDEELEKITAKINREKYELPESSKNGDGSTDLKTKRLTTQQINLSKNFLRIMRFVFCLRQSVQRL